MRIYLITIILVFGFVAISNAQSYKIIVNNSNTTSVISKKELSNLFLKKKSNWPDGKTVMPVDLGISSKVREDFSQAIHGKNISAVRNFWHQAAFSGTATAPSEKNTDDEVVDFVRKNAGAIGYVSSTANTSSVKTIIIN